MIKEKHIDSISSSIHLNIHHFLLYLKYIYHLVFSNCRKYFIINIQSHQLSMHLSLNNKNNSLLNSSVNFLMLVLCFNLSFFLYLTKKY
jgi:hypothetical protein